MWQSDYQYYAFLTSQAGESIGDVRLDVDWVPAVRWTEFETRVKDMCEFGDAPARPVIEPKWGAEGGPPYVCGFGISAGVSTPVEFPLAYFSSAVSKAATQLVETGALEAGQLFNYKVYALAKQADRDSAPPRLDLVAIDTLPTIARAPLGPLLARAVTSMPRSATTEQAPSEPTGETMPVLIPQRVLDEATELARRVGDVETGGILVGQLCRDPDGTLFASVTAQILAEHTEATRQTLRFTPETWAGVDAAIKLRNRSEIALGWWHNHPFFCANCSAEQRSVCPFAVPTFSADDKHVHREVFQPPWSVALLLSFLGEERPSYDLFAWNRGQIEAVKFFTLPECGGYTGDVT